MATAEPCVTADFALGYRDMMLQGLAGEVNTTRKVLAAIPEAKKDYRHDPNCRTAWGTGLRQVQHGNPGRGAQTKDRG